MSKNKKGGLFAGVLTGILMVIIGTGVLWWNEGNNVRNIKTTDEVEKNVVEITSNSDCAKYAGQLVAVGDKFTIEDKEVSDSAFEVSLHTASLIRVVEMYQWDEDSDTDDDGVTTYSYDGVWRENLINSSSFHDSRYKNPSSMPYKSDSFYAKKIILGNFTLNKSQIMQMSADTVRIPSADTVKMPEGYKTDGEYVTNSANLSSPKIGDIRISWKYNDWDEVSLIAKVNGNGFVSYVSKSGKDVNYVYEGVRSAAEMIEAQRNQDKLMKWIFRLIGALLIFLGYMSFISPLTKLVSYIPILGNVVNFMFVLVIFLLSLIQSLLVILIAWFRYRPVLSICLLAACAVITVLIVILKKKKPAASQPVQTV